MRYYFLNQTPLFGEYIEKNSSSARLVDGEIVQWKTVSAEGRLVFVFTHGGETLGWTDNRIAAYVIAQNMSLCTIEEVKKKAGVKQSHL